MSFPVTLITGTSRGIGKYLAEYYVALGHHVIGCSRTKPEWELQNYQHFETDVATESSVRQIFSTIRKQYGRLDNLINNAGIASLNHSLLMPIKSVVDTLSTNVVGTFLFSREAAKLMMVNKYGRIINFSTVALPLSLEGESAYVASKAGVVGLTRVLSKEFAKLGITVNAVGPTPIDTDLIRGVPKQKLDALIQMQAIQRMGELKDLSNVVDFFIRPESNFITGQIIYLGGVN